MGTIKKNFLTICAIGLIGFSACTGAYKSSQTPDDVYYSPARGDRGAAAGYYDDYTASTDDNYLRMKVRDHYRWSDLDDYAYWNDSRYYSNNYFYSDFYNYNWVNNYGAFGWGMPYYYNPYGGWYGFYGNHWNSWYNPYYTVISYKSPQVARTLSSGSNLSAFSNRNYNNSNQLYRTDAKGVRTNYNNSNTGNNNTNFGSLVRKVFSPGNNEGNGNNNQSRSWETPSRSYNNNNGGSYTPPSNSAGGRSGGYNSSGGGTGGRPTRN